MKLMAVTDSPHGTIMDRLPFGLAVPLREVARTCQLSPAGDWPIAAYKLIGRNDLAEGMSNQPDPLTNHGYRSVRDHLVSIPSLQVARF